TPPLDRLPHQIGILDGCGADYGARNRPFEHLLDISHGTETATRLDADRDAAGDGTDELAVGAVSEGGIEVDYMDPGGARVDETLRLSEGVRLVDRLSVSGALLQPYTAPTPEVD